MNKIKKRHQDNEGRKKKSVKKEKLRTKVSNDIINEIKGRRNPYILDVKDDNIYNSNVDNINTYNIIILLLHLPPPPPPPLHLLYLLLLLQHQQQLLLLLLLLMIKLLKI